MEVGQRLRSLRKARELTQVQLAKEVGIDQSTVSDIERGASFTAEVLIRLCDALGADPRYVMTGEGEPNSQAELIGLFSRLGEQDRENVLRIVRALVGR